MLKQNGQSTIEYILIFVAVVVVILIALAPGGFYTKAVNSSLDESIKGLEYMANSVTWNVYAPPGN